jgi:hypothetical protein
MECEQLTAQSTVPPMTAPTSAPVTVLPPRRRPAVLTGLALAAVALLGLAGLIGWGAAEQTRPGLCIAEQRGGCAYKITPLRGGQIHVRIDLENVEPRGEWIMPETCLRPEPPAGACPAWVSNWEGVTAGN